MPRILAHTISTISYFSMEVALDPAIPTYSGGLGMLAGDTLRAAADFGVPIVGMTLLYRKGYFRQHLDERGNQTESPVAWTPEEFLLPMLPRITVTIEGRKVQVRAWLYTLHGVSKHDVHVYFLDTALPENTPWDQTLTDSLYGGDHHYRLCQEVLLGLGGFSMLQALGYDNVQVYHMNEGHSALLYHSPAGADNGGERYPFGNRGRQGSRPEAMCVYHAYPGPGWPGPVFTRPGAPGAG